MKTTITVDAVVEYQLPRGHKWHKKVVERKIKLNLPCASEDEAPLAFILGKPDDELRYRYYDRKLWTPAYRDTKWEEEPLTPDQIVEDAFGRLEQKPRLLYYDCAPSSQGPNTPASLRRPSRIASHDRGHSPLRQIYRWVHSVASLPHTAVWQMVRSR